MKIIGDLEREGITFESLSEKIDTGSASGKLQFHVFAALAEFERNLIRERTLAGLSAARARGRVGGRPAKLNAKQIRATWPGWIRGDGIFGGSGVQPHIRDSKGNRDRFVPLREATQALRLAIFQGSKKFRLPS